MQIAHNHLNLQQASSSGKLQWLSLANKVLINLVNTYVSRQFNLQFQIIGQIKMLKTGAGLAMTHIRKVKMQLRVTRLNLKLNAWLSTILQTLIQEW